jgi:ATP-binding cassette subfamily B protein
MTAVGSGRVFAYALLVDGFRVAPRLLLTYAALNVGHGLISVAYPCAFAVLIDAVLRADHTAVALSAVGVAALVTLTRSLGPLAANAGSALTERVQMSVSERLARLVSSTDGIEHLERPDYLAELDLLKMHRDALASAPVQAMGMLQMIVRAGSVLVVLATVDPRLMILPAVGVVPLAAERWSARQRYRNDEQLAEDRRLATMIYSLTSTPGPAKELRVFDLGTELVGRHERLARHITRATVRAELRALAASVVGWALSAAAMLVSIGLVVERAAAGFVTPGQVLLTVAIAQRAQTELSDLANGLPRLQLALRTARRLRWLEAYAVADTDPRTGTPVPHDLQHGVELDRVSFRYHGRDSDAVADVSLRLPAGSVVALVGENGAGKSTLVKLLTGMYRPTNGVIRVDKRPLADLSMTEWRTRVAAGFQDYVCYELSVSENVGVGDLPRLDDIHAIRAALGRADAGDLVGLLDGGLTARLGRVLDDGRELSGGQWQKLALARAMMRDDPLLLVLDEPTATLDAYAEHRLFKRYAAQARRATTRGAIIVLVSHRFSTVRMADLIVVLDRGRVVEVGTHAELRTAGGLYAELFEIQAGAFR